MRVLGRRVLVKIGEPLSVDPARVFVAEFQAQEIEWVRAFRRVTKMYEGGQIETRSTLWLELKLRVADLTELAARIKTAGAPRVWHGWKSTTPIPVRVTSEGVLRVEWNGEHCRMAPSLKRAVEILERDFQVLPEVKEREDYTKSDADKKKMEGRIVELVERGEMIEAMKVARGLYGFSLKEAKEFVEELRGQGE
jgi:hypothetical protein